MTMLLVACSEVLILVSVIFLSVAPCAYRTRSCTLDVGRRVLMKLVSHSSAMVVRRRRILTLVQSCSSTHCDGASATRARTGHNLAASCEVAMLHSASCPSRSQSNAKYHKPIVNIIFDWYLNLTTSTTHKSVNGA